ncbi:MAG: 23S rRNA (uracil(1939)-C(5))-methyltransferase RlmD [Clostridia bacterium]|nr:23S rRNA (uracil(1939)-C(5))-methyltransferase RlmD [Clostridia bacterium]
MENTYIVDIFDVSYEGAGVGKIDGQIVFVPKCLPGEQVEVQIVKRTNSFLIGKILRILKESENRVQAVCPYFSECGGCDFQHCDYETEQKLKKDVLRNELKKVGFDGQVDLQKSPSRFSYRNKLKFDVVDGILCYHKVKSKELFEVKICPIATKEINDALSKVENLLETNHFKNLKSVYLKQVEKDVAICFLFSKNEEKVVKNVKKMQILSGFSVFFAFGNILESNETKIIKLFGGGLFKTFQGQKIVIDVSAFNQVNDEIASLLYDYVCENAAGKRVVNAYSGQGFLTFLLSQNAKFVYGIEYQKSAHESAEKLSSQLQSEYKIENICGKVEECLPNVLLRDSIDLIVLDPAREGCDKKVVEAINDSQIDEILYISCNFASLVRDLRILNEKYDVEKVKIFDMFPCTANMETVAKLRRKTVF